MDRTSTPTASNALEADIAAATSHLKASWESGKDAAQDARRIAETSLHDLSRDVDRYVEARPKTIALWALGTGLVVGFLTGLLTSRTVRARAARD